MKNLFLFLSIIINTNTFSQTGLSKTIENNVTKNQQTKEVVDYENQYSFYLNKANRQQDLSTAMLITGTIVTTTILANIDGMSYNRGQAVALSNTLFVGLSTTFMLTSNKNRKKAYQLKKPSYI
jgi:hypothetical protein